MIYVVHYDLTVVMGITVLPARQLTPLHSYDCNRSGSMLKDYTCGSHVLFYVFVSH